MRASRCRAPNVALVSIRMNANSDLKDAVALGLPIHHERMCDPAYGARVHQAAATMRTEAFMCRRDGRCIWTTLHLDYLFRLVRQMNNR